MKLTAEDIELLILEAYASVLNEAEPDEEEPEEEEIPEPEEVTPEDLPDDEQSEVDESSMDDILEKFPTLRKNMVDLLTSDYRNFVEDIAWVAPKPTTFKVTLKNDQLFHLKWLGKGFEAEVAGMRYYLPRVDQYQQALDRVSEILKYAAPLPAGEFGEEGGVDSEFGGGEGGTFPGEEGGGGGFEGGIEEPAGAGEEPAGADAAFDAEPGGAPGDEF